MKGILLILLIVLVSAASITGILILNNPNDSHKEVSILLEGLGDNNINRSGNQESPTGNNIIESTSSEGDSGANSDSETESSPQIECKTQHIQYSLKNFKENIVCLENALGRCTKLSALCSVYIYNLDMNTTENFEIEYSLIETSEKVLDAILIHKNIKVETPEKFEANFTIEDDDGIDVNSKCNIAIKTVPQKEICN